MCVDLSGQEQWTIRERADGSEPPASENFLNVGRFSAAADVPPDLWRPGPASVRCSASPGLTRPLLPPVNVASCPVKTASRAVKTALAKPDG